jgi:chromodomain-helicase-DNA-binding protein 1
LEQFNVSDVAVNQMTWDELVPEHLRDKIDPADMDEIPEELLMEGLRRRAATTVRYTGAELNLQTGQKRKRKSAASSKNKLSSPDSKLAEKEIKSLIRALLKYGDIERRYEDIVMDADISHKMKDIVVECTNAIIRACHKACDEAPPEPKTTDSKGNKSKLVSATYQGVPITNAQQLIQRVTDLTVLAKRLEKQKVKSFRIPWTTKPITNWSTQWGSKDDSMLLVGIYKHGFGSWDVMQDDNELPFQKKFFLSGQDKFLPKGVHLVRRGEILLKMLRENETAILGGGEKAAPTGKLVPTPSNARTPKDPSKSLSSQAKKPSGSKLKRSPSNLEERRKEPSKAASKEDISMSSRASSSKSKASTKPKAKKVDDSSESESMDHARCKEELRPIKRELRGLESPPDIPAQEKAQLIKNNLITVGRFIDNHCTKITSDTRRKKAERHLWKFASYFWPNKISSEQYHNLYRRILAKLEHGGSN